MKSELPFFVPLDTVKQAQEKFEEQPLECERQERVEEKPMREPEKRVEETPKR